MRRDFVISQNTEEVTLSGKRTHIGRTSGEIPWQRNTEGAKFTKF